MQIQDLQKIKHLHHAYIVLGTEHAPSLVLAMLRERGIETAGNPDVLSLSFSELLVDDVRDTVLPFASLSPIHDRKYIAIAFSRANDSAQNALLKAVEESLGKTTFFFCVESAGHILPTLRSRCITLEGGRLKVEGGSTEAEEFLKAAYSKRLALVEKMTNYISKTQDRAPARAFANDLLILAREKKLSTVSVRDILDATQYLRMQGGSAKSALSHLAVSLPQKK